MAQTFIWHDLMTTDTKAAEAFYKAVIGWTMADSGQPGGGYTVLMAGQAPVGGIMAIPEGETMPPCWTGYIGVDDVDAWTGKVAAKGGKVWKAPQDIPGVGRFSVVADPHGAAFIGDADHAAAGVSALPQHHPAGGHQRFEVAREGGRIHLHVGRQLTGAQGTQLVHMGQQ